MNAVKFTISLIVVIFTLIGGAIVFLQTPLLGVRSLVGLVAISILVFIVKYTSEVFGPAGSPVLVRTDFGSFLSKPALKEKYRNEFDQLNDITKCALALLLLEQTDSGMWSYSYLYRRLISKEGIPLSRGSLTGTPLALFGILSVIEKDDHEFFEYLTRNLAETLNKVIQPDGQYLRRYTVGQFGRVPELEPPRHTAGGLLSKIIIGNITDLDKKSLKFLLSVRTLPNAWDKAIQIRTFTSVIYNRNFGLLDRMKAHLRRAKLIKLLVNEAKFAKHQSLMWSHPYEYGRDINNQWATVWATYPLLSDKLLQRRKRKTLQIILGNLVRSHVSAAVDKLSLLPAEISRDSFQGKGEYVFSTVLAPLIYNVFENYLHIGLGASDPNSIVLLRRILDNSVKIIKNPSTSSPRDVQSLEGYFAWAGICLTAASFGIRIDKTSTKLIVNSIGELKDMLNDSWPKGKIYEHVESCLSKYNVFPSHLIRPLTYAATALLSYQTRVRKEVLGRA